MNVLRAVKLIDYALKALTITEGVLFMSENSENQAQEARRKAEQELDEAKNRVEETAGQVKDKAQEAYGQAREQVEQVREGGRRYWEEIEVEGRQLIDRVKELIQEGNVRRLIIKDEEGKYLLEIPLTVGVVAGSILALAAPVMAALGALAALVARVKIEVQREDDAGK